MELPTKMVKKLSKIVINSNFEPSPLKGNNLCPRCMIIRREIDWDSLSKLPNPKSAGFCRGGHKKYTEFKQATGLICCCLRNPTSAFDWYPSSWGG